MLLMLVKYLKKQTTTQKLKKLKKTQPDHDKYIANHDFNKTSGEIFDERLKQAKLVTNLIFLTL